MPGDLVRINMHGGEVHESPSHEVPKPCPFCLDADGKHLDNALCFSTVLQWSLQVGLEQILGVCLTSERNELLSSLFTLPLNWDLLIASAISNHHLIFCLIFSLHLSYNWSPCLLQRFSFSIFLSLFYFSSVSFVNLLLIPQCHLSLPCPCLQLLLSATTFWVSSISNTFLCSLLLPGYPLIFIYQSLQFFATLGREDTSVHT